VFGLSIGPKESGLQTPGWKELSDEERKRENAELVRLLYVAVTRARDHLVLCTHTQNWKVPEHGQHVPDTDGTRLKPLSPLIENCLSKETGLVHWLDAGSLDAPKRPRQQPLTETRDFKTVLENEYRELRTILSDTPSSRDLKPAGKGKGESDQADSAPEDRSPEAAGNRSVRLGVAFHEAMERVDLFRQEDLGGAVRELIARHSLDRDSAGKLLEMIRTTLSSELMERARAAANAGGRILRELPFVRPLNGGVEEGKIDLLFEEREGWVLIDYKTDWVSSKMENVEEYFLGKYSGQIREYAGALNALSVKVSSAYLLLARTGTAIQVV
jgi:ATP-dependent helicase/nuclease subunit A